MNRLGIIFFLFVLTSQIAFAHGSGMTDFNPTEDGFNFENGFKNIVISEIDLVTGGLCGGMVYSSLDYFYSSRNIPD